MTNYEYQNDTFFGIDAHEAMSSMTNYVNKLDDWELDTYQIVPPQGKTDKKWTVCAVFFREIEEKPEPILLPQPGDVELWTHWCPDVTRYLDLRTKFCILCLKRQPASEPTVVRTPATTLVYGDPSTRVYEDGTWSHKCPRYHGSWVSAYADVASCHACGRKKPVVVLPTQPHPEDEYLDSLLSTRYGTHPKSLRERLMDAGWRRVGF